MTEAKNPIRIGLANLDQEILEKIALLAEDTIERYLLKRVGKSNLLNLDTSVNVEYNDELTIDISAQVTFSPLFEEKKEEILNKAIEAAFDAIEKKLREISNERRNKKQGSGS